MSARLNEYPFLRQTVQHHNRPQQKDSPERTNSDSSVTMESEKVMITPPTPYYADDEFSGLTDTGSHNIRDADAESEDIKKDVKLKHDVSTPSDGGEGPDVTVDPVCAGEADGPCTLGSGDHRKVVSHVFGRNKRCTHQIPDDCWIKYCRKHYQRQKYRCPADWFETQLLLIDGQIDKMEAWGGITSWTIAVRKKERVMLDDENSYIAQHGRLPSGPNCRERFLLPYLGSNKTFADIRNLVDVINRECDTTKNFTLPSFELLPAIDERRNPRPKRLGAARRLARSGGTATPSTFRLSTDYTGQLLKTEASPSCTGSRAGSRIPHRASPLPMPEKEISNGMKRSASVFDDGDDEKSDVKSTRPVKRPHHEKGENEPIISRTRSIKHQDSNEDKKNADVKYALPVKRYKRSHSF